MHLREVAATTSLLLLFAAPRKRLLFARALGLAGEEVGVKEAHEPLGDGVGCGGVGAAASAIVAAIATATATATAAPTLRPSPPHPLLF